METVTYLLKDIPKNIWKKFKEKCNKNNISIKETLLSMIEIEALMEDYKEDNEDFYLFNNYSFEGTY